MTIMTRTLAKTLLLSALGCLASCGTPGEDPELDTTPVFVPYDEPEPQPEPAPAPWTSTFQSAALLIADEIRIEGPKGLLNHIATRIEPDHHTYAATTLPEGFQQSFEPRNLAAGIDIRAYLDGLEVVALKRLVLLERPGDVQVIVEAVGDAFWRESSSGNEKRGSALRFVGERPE